jgi:uncharacterized protein involved in tolerance to divalent cations
VVVGTVNDANYAGSVTNTLVIGKASAPVTLANLSSTYDGTARCATATTVPSGLAVTLTYNGSAACPTNAGSYVVVGTVNDANYAGSVTNTLVIGKASAPVTLANLTYTYDGTARCATATTVPSDLVVTFTYNGSSACPTNAGSYVVVGTVNDANYAGSVTNTLVIGKASVPVTLANLTYTYDGTARCATATTVPSGLAVTLTYNGSAACPTNAGGYVVVGTINEANYAGSVTNTLVIGKASAPVTLANLSSTYDGAARCATATTVPSGLAVTLTYNGLAACPTNAGGYVVVGTINEANYEGSVTNTLVVGKAVAAVTLTNLSSTYDGTARCATATTVPSGLALTLTYNGSAACPTNVGSYLVVGMVNEANYVGSATNTLVITSSVSTDPTNLVASVTAGVLTLSWPASHTGWTLQVQTNGLSAGLGSNWLDVPGTSATNRVSLPMATDGVGVFYRLRYGP